MTDVRLTDLMTALSLAVDLGLGQPAGHVVRSAVVAARLDSRQARPSAPQEVFDVAMLGWVGCIADSQDAARWFGDDISYRAGVYDLDMAPLPFLGYLLGRAGSADPLPVRAARKAAVLLDAGRSARRSLLAHCQVTAQVASRLDMPERVCTGLTQIFARWDGRGLPTGLAGTQIQQSVRAWQLADLAEVHHRRGGEAAVRRVCLERRGGQLCPELVDLALTDVGGLFAGLDDEDDWERLLARERGSGPSLPPSAVDSVLEALADWIDLKSRWFSGHSRAVADLAAGAGRVLGLEPKDVSLVRRAGLVSDLGRAGISNAVWDKVGPLSTTELERLRLHSYLTERVVGRVAALAEVGAVAAMAHERLDGSGYHRGLTGAAIPVTARVLAAAEAYRTSLEPRPHRKALTREEAAARLRAEASAGRIDPRAVSAVLAAAGHRADRAGTSWPCGLTDREVEVLGLIARGLTTRQVARLLGISPKTAGNHVEHVYAKTGVSTRAAATLFAMEHRLVPVGDPYGVNSS